MFYQITKLILIMSKNRLLLFLKRNPMMWCLIAGGVLIYVAGSYFTDALLSEAITPMLAVSSSVASMKSSIMFAFFCSFGLMTFLLMILSMFLLPDETIISRVVTPLPIPTHHHRIGILLPGLLCLLVAQVLFWFPFLVVLHGAQMFSLPVLILVLLLGWLCYSTVTLAFYQGISLLSLLVTRIFGGLPLGCVW